MTRQFVSLASRLLTIAMLPLLVGLAIDTYVLGRLILHAVAPSVAVAAIVAAMLIGLWYVLPRVMHR